MRFKIGFLTTMSLLFLSGCSSVPWITLPATDYTVVNTRAYDRPFDKVWENILAFGAKNGMILRDVDKSNGLINAELTSFEDDIADCGKDTSMNVTGRRGALNIFVNREGNSVVVTINNELNESRTMMTAATTTKCSSKGVLEARILDAAGA